MKLTVKLVLIGFMVMGMVATATTAFAAGDTIKIGILTSKSGVLSEWGMQDLRGFILGFEYATGGTNAVLGKKIEIVQEDDASTPQIRLRKSC